MYQSSSLKETITTIFPSMGIFRCFFKTAAIGTAAGTGGALYLNSRSTVTPISPDDALFQSKHFRKLNPLNSATFGDVCTKRVPLRNIDPYLRNEARLTTAFTGGIFGGLGTCLSLWGGWMLRGHHHPEQAG